MLFFGKPVEGKRIVGVFDGKKNFFQMGNKKGYNKQKCIFFK